MSSEELTFDVGPQYDLGNFTKNPVWELVENDTYSVNESRVGIYFETNDVHLKLTVKRKSLYYMINNVYSCLILNAITLLTFFIPFAVQATLSKKLFF